MPEAAQKLVALRNAKKYSYTARKYSASSFLTGRSARRPLQGGKNRGWIRLVGSHAFTSGGHGSEKSLFERKKSNRNWNRSEKKVNSKQFHSLWYQRKKLCVVLYVIFSCTCTWDNPLLGVRVLHALEGILERWSRQRYSFHMSHQNASQSCIERC